MTKEQLEKLGLDEEQIKEVFKLNGKAVENAKGDLSSKEQTIETLQSQLKVANDEIEKFKDLDVDEIKSRAEDYKEKFEQAQAEAEEKLETLKFEHQLENAIRDSDARNIKAVKALLDVETLKDSKEQSEDIKAALESVKKENDFLFETEQNSQGNNPKFTRPAGQAGSDPITKESIMNIKDPIERKRTIADNIELFE